MVSTVSFCLKAEFGCGTFRLAIMVLPHRRTNFKARRLRRRALLFLECPHGIVLSQTGKHYDRNYCRLNSSIWRY